MDGQTQKIYDQTLHFLSFRPRTTSEIKAFLKRHHATSKQEEEIESKLQDLGLLDDEAFVRWWIEQRQTFKPRGLRVIQNELRSKGVSQEIIEKVFEEYGESKKVLEINLARMALHKILGRFRDIPQNEFYVKMGKYLTGLGFTGETVRNVIDEIYNKE